MQKTNKIICWIPLDLKLQVMVCNFFIDTVPLSNVEKHMSTIEHSVDTCTYECRNKIENQIDYNLVTN